MKTLILLIFKYVGAQIECLKREEYQKTEKEYTKCNNRKTGSLFWFIHLPQQKSYVFNLLFRNAKNVPAPKQRRERGEISLQRQFSEIFSQKKNSSFIYIEI